MTAREHLQRAVDDHLSRLRAGIPSEREAALLSVLRAVDDLPRLLPDPIPDLITGRLQLGLGAGLAINLCLEQPDQARGDVPSLSRWAGAFLGGCHDLAAAQLVLAHAETGFMRLIESEGGGVDAWIAMKRAPARWRERADVDWWAGWLVRQHLEPAERLANDGYDRTAGTYLKEMAYQHGHAADATLGGIAFQTWRDVVRVLIAFLLEAQDAGRAPVVVTETALVAAVGSRLGLDPAVAAAAISVITADAEGVAWHTGVPGAAFPPLVRLDGGRVALSARGLLTEPFFFLARELRRRDPEAYHNAAASREDAFRQELYDLFRDRRFVVAPSRIILRSTTGSIRTDVDAAVFDRKTGTLGVFELKFQDPFARSTAELARQRDNMLYASRQVAGVLDWINRNGADEILRRMDRQAAKRFRVSKVYPFVLGRYLARFDGGPVPDRPAAWGTWPQVLRLLHKRPIGAKDANPIAAIFSRLAHDVLPVEVPVELPPRAVSLGGDRLVVYPSFAVYRDR